MSKAMEVVQDAYAAFGSGDMPRLLSMLDEKVDWECMVPGHIAYSGRRIGVEAVQKWFEQLPTADRIEAFEPREFIDGGEHVTVLGWEKTTALETGRNFESEWAHVFTVRNGRISRWRGFYDTLRRNL